MLCQLEGHPHLKEDIITWDILFDIYYYYYHNLLFVM